MLSDTRLARASLAAVVLVAGLFGFGVGNAMPAGATDGCGGDYRIIDRRDAYGYPTGASLRGHLENNRCLDFGLQEFRWYGWQESKTSSGSNLYVQHYLRVRGWTCGSLYADDSASAASTWRTWIRTGYSNHNLCPPQGDAYGEFTGSGYWRWTWYRNV